MIKIAAFECVIYTVNSEDDCNDFDDMADFHGNTFHKSEVRNSNKQKQ